MKVNSCDALEMNSGELNTTMKESPKRYTNPFLSDEENDKLNLWNNQEHEHSINDDTFTTNLEDENFEKAKELYIDKIACYEESAFHVVKDICVDNGLSHDKNIKIDKKHHELSCEPDTNTDTGTDTVTVNEEDKHNDVSEDSYKSTDLCLVNEEKPDTDFPATKHEDVIEGNHDTDISTQSSSQEKDTKEDENGPLNCVICVSDDLKLFVESDIAKSTESCGPEKPESIHELSLGIESAPNKDMASDSVTVANQLQHGGGESSFSMAGPVSGLIINSGRIASCGSISHRSDGSNTSVRSFAFPILQTEWNSSPVRMAKVDQRRSRKHRGWRQALACCRF